MVAMGRMDLSLSLSHSLPGQIDPHTRNHRRFYATRAVPVIPWLDREGCASEVGKWRKQKGEREREREGSLIQFNYVMNCRVLSKHPSSPRLAAGKSPVGGYTLLARRRGWSGGGLRATSTASFSRGGDTLGRGGWSEVVDRGEDSR